MIERLLKMEKMLFERAKLAGFFAKVPDVIGGNNRLDVSGEASASRLEIKTLVDEMDFDALV